MATASKVERCFLQVNRRGWDAASGVGDILKQLTKAGAIAIGQYFLGAELIEECFGVGVILTLRQLSGILH